MLINMMRIKSFRSASQTKEEFSANEILRKISRKESFKISQYFNCTERKEHKLPKVTSMALKSKAKEYFDPWEIHKSNTYKRSFRARHREVIDKIKMKQVLVPPMNFKLSNDLQKKIMQSGNIQSINNKFL